MAKTKRSQKRRAEAARYSLWSIPLDVWEGQPSGLEALNLDAPAVRRRQGLSDDAKRCLRAFDVQPLEEDTLRIVLD